MSEIIRVLGIGDLHDDPRQTEKDKDRYDWIGKYIADNEFDRIVFIGDVLSLDSISSHEGGGTLAGRKKPSFADDIASGRDCFKRIWAPSQALWERSSRLHLRRPLITPVDLTLGNHDEARVHRYENEHPAMEGQLWGQIEDLYSAFDITPYKQMLDIGGVKFTHIPQDARGQPMSGVNPSANIALNSNYDVVHGHTHMHNVVTRKKLDGDYTRVIDLGCALPDGKIEDYAKHSMTAWSWGINKLTIIDGHVFHGGFVTMRELAWIYGN